MGTVNLADTKAPPEQGLGAAKSQPSCAGASSMLTLCRRMAAIGFPTNSVDGLKPAPTRYGGTSVSQGVKRT